MNRVELAPGIQVSRLGLGSVKFGRNQGVKYPKAFELPSDQEILTLLSVAQELGINLLDTAPAYGLAETRIGELLRNRSEWVLGSKVGESFDGQSHFDFSKAGAARSLQQSLSRLKTDYLDYCLLHSDGNDLEVLESGACEALFEAKQSGAVRAIGMSSKTAQGGLKALEMGLDVVMITLNAQEQAELEVSKRASDQNRGVLVKKALGSGHLSAADSLAFVAGQSSVSSIISGTLNTDHLIENARIVREHSDA
jgi:aryl-alcohol dehydrogenase-like predicted oxidoreductase